MKNRRLREQSLRLKWMNSVKAKELKFYANTEPSLEIGRCRDYQITG